MKKTVLITVFIIFSFVIIAGCMMPVGPGPVSLTQTPAPTPTARVPATIPPPSGGLVPGTTQVPPDYLGAAFDVQKDSVFAVITVTYRDGLGQSLLQYSVARVTLADGTVVQGTIQPLVGESYQTQGTKRSDRVEIFVTYADGSVYKVYDQLVPFQNLNPV
jgi:hypothetical protein